MDFETITIKLVVKIDCVAGYFTWGVLLGIFGGGVPPTSPNPDPISDQKMPFPTPVFRPDLARD